MKDPKRKKKSRFNFSNQTKSLFRTEHDHRSLISYKLNQFKCTHWHHPRHPLHQRCRKFPNKLPPHRPGTKRSSHQLKLQQRLWKITVPKINIGSPYLYIIIIIWWQVILNCLKQVQILFFTSSLCLYLMMTKYGIVSSDYKQNSKIISGSRNLMPYKLWLQLPDLAL